MLDFGRLRESSLRVRNAIGSQTSGALAYTCFCLLTLVYALCLVTMPDRAIERVSLLSYFH